MQKLPLRIVFGSIIAYICYFATFFLLFMILWLSMVITSDATQPQRTETVCEILSYRVSPGLIYFFKVSYETTNSTKVESEFDRDHLSYKVGEKIPCFYNPKDTQDVIPTPKKNFTIFYVIGFSLLSFGTLFLCGILCAFVVGLVLLEKYINNREGGNQSLRLLQ